jgi:hypothetical protein
MVGSDPRNSAFLSAEASSNKLSDMNNKLAGGKKRKWGGNIAVPQFQMNYTPQNGPGQDPNSQIAQSSQIGTQSAANAVYDSQATKMGGSRRLRGSRRQKRGGNPNWEWGCLSGGKYRKTKSKSKSRKMKKKSMRKSRKYSRKH